MSRESSPRHGPSAVVGGDLVVAQFFHHRRRINMSPASWMLLAVCIGLSLIPSDCTQEPGEEYEDQKAEPSNQYIGRVQLKVFRGTSSPDGSWAPHGFWVRQPADPNNN